MMDDSPSMQPPTESFRPPEPTDSAVQATYLDAASAKMSCAEKGYFVDRWTELLVRKPSRPQVRSPLIHRGYYSRVSGIRSTVTRFLERAPAGRGVQIVNLGAGFDTLYFWIRENTALWRDDLVYFEVDFPEILSKKVSAMLRQQSLWPLLDGTSSEELVAKELSSSGTRELRTKHCRYVSADMRMMNELSSAIAGAGFRSDVPTLFIAECVLVYMQSLHSSALVEWAASAVSGAPSAMVVYEQVNPNDRFGKVMVENLKQRGCPLLSIHDFPTLEAQRDRYLQRGWGQCQLSDMNQVHETLLDRKDVDRIHRLEMLDELEEWRLLMGHYFLLVATRTGEAVDGEWVHEVPVHCSVEVMP
eukprot:gnl/TRDRNA2_/TRDRNA2_188668_c0_seq1.p1 gnl/TRDRNA2_/TRDRNA2_188668_c0~~gnl/TRDRNA2_/TRDRNA2_188668_c0_seq1.p1  ORF type:complete len:360 (+),score=51.66 gnl/TRDRNA2_/TRDRNA2_188668_c0_seq1:126-1205(+)